MQAAVGVAAYAMAVRTFTCTCTRILLALVAAYLPSFLDGSERTADGKLWPWFAKHPFFDRLWSWFPAKCTFAIPIGQQGGIDPEKRYIFCSHPHGDERLSGRTLRDTTNALGLTRTATRMRIHRTFSAELRRRHVPPPLYVPVRRLRVPPREPPRDAARPWRQVPVTHPVPSTH